MRVERRRQAMERLREKPVEKQQEADDTAHYGRSVQGKKVVELERVSYQTYDGVGALVGVLIWC